MKTMFRQSIRINYRVPCGNNMLKNKRHKSRQIANLMPSPASLNLRCRVMSWSMTYSWLKKSYRKKGGLRVDLQLPTYHHR